MLLLFVLSDVAFVGFVVCLLLLVLILFVVVDDVAICC